MASRLRLLLSVLVASALCWWVLQRVGFDQAVTLVRTADPRLLTLGLLAIAIAYAVRGARWLLWDRSAGYLESTASVLVGFMGNNVLPARLGEVMRADWVARRSEAAHGRTSVLASVGTERVFDGLSLSVLALAGVALSSVDKRVAIPLVLAAGAFTGIALVVLASAIWESRIRQLLAKANQVFPGHLTASAHLRANYAIDGLVRLRGPKAITLALVASFLVWIIEASAYLAIAYAISPFTIPTAVVLLGVVNFASLFPLTIAGVGAMEGAGTAYLMTAGFPADHAFAIVATHHVMQIALTTLPGGYIYLTTPRARRRPAAAPSAAALAPSLLDETERTLRSFGSDLELQPQRATPLSLSIVIPAFNEQNRLPKTLLATLRWCKRHLSDYEVIVVDDGSSDQTLAIAELVRDSVLNVRTLACAHLGKGAAVRAGMLNARGKYVLFMDADGATPLDEIPKLVARLDRGAHVAIGSRVLQHPGEVEVETSFLRRFMGRTFAAVVNVLAIGGIGDTQCGFKMFKRDVVRPLFAQQKLNGFAFDVEILVLARRLALHIEEVPVNWTNQPGSKVNLVLDSLKMLRDLLRVRWLHRHQTLRQAAALAQTDTQ